MHTACKSGAPCGDTQTGVTVYSYPASIHANAAKRNPETTARSILAEQGSYRGDPAIVWEYDMRSWARLNAKEA